MIAAMTVRIPVLMPRLNGPNDNEKIGSLQHSSDEGVVKLSGGIESPKPSVGKLTVGREMQDMLCGA
jgi:hypothetical protein